MARDGSGTYNLPAGNPVVTDTAIDSSDHNTTQTDIATALTNSLARNGEGPPTANQPFGGFKITGLGIGTAKTDGMSLANQQAQTATYSATVGGTSDVITLTPSPALTAYAAGNLYFFIAGGANTTNITVNISGLGAKAVTKRGATALIANDITNAALVVIQYDGTQFQLINVAEVDLTSAQTITGLKTLSGVALDHAVHSEAAHATTSDIWAGGMTCLLTGSVVTFTDIADAPQAGSWRFVVSNAAHIITDNAAIEMDGNANYTCAAGDVFLVTAKTTATFRWNLISRGDTTSAPAASTTVAGVSELGTLAEVKTGTDAARIPTIATMQDGKAVLDTMIDASSGTPTEVDFTGIPSWAKRITIMFDGISTNGTSQLMVQIGDAGGFETTGYLGSSSTTTTVALSTAHTTGFGVNSGAAANIFQGALVLTLMDASTFLWVAHGSWGFNNVAGSGYGGGAKNLSATLTQVRFTTVNGTDTFDAGNVNIMYE